MPTEASVSPHNSVKSSHGNRPIFEFQPIYFSPFIFSVTSANIFECNTTLAIYTLDSLDCKAERITEFTV